MEETLFDDVLASYEYRDVRRSHYRTPEWHLMRAMLLDALQLITQGPTATLSNGHNYRHARDVEEARLWFLGVGSKHAALFSVESVCDHLGVDLAGLRHAFAAGTLRVGQSYHLAVAGTRFMGRPAADRAGRISA